MATMKWSIEICNEENLCNKLQQRALTHKHLVVDTQELTPHLQQLGNVMKNFNTQQAMINTKDTQKNNDNTN